ncbi:MAG: alanine racemase, partial [Crocinitomicaceae bacterium]
LNVASFFNVNIALEKGILPDLAMRLESFDGVENSVILNDTYSFDLESLETSLQYLSSLEKGKKRIVLLPQMDNSKNKGIIELFKKYQIDDYHFIKSKSDITFSLSHSTVLVVGGKGSNMNRIAGQLKLKHHRTKIEINLNAIRKNIHLVKDRLSSNTKCLVMVKANAYGTGLIKVGQYIEKIGADYIGVAYADEGVALRKNGVNCPILVMNVGIDDFQDCINYHLEPSVYSLSILDEFVKMLIADEIKGFPIHLKVDTGMNRLGIQPNEVEKFITILKSQPEITLKGVYSHFAESDNTENPNFTNSQLKTFLDVCSKISERVSGSFIRHMSNSDGVLNFPKSQLDMVRLGLVVYGISNNSKINRSLTSVIKWSSQVAQIKTVKKGETVGYGRAYIAKNEMRIAIIPVGYADGFRRSLGNGKGSVFIKGQVFYTVGNVCMDMIMIDISNEDVLPGDLVEIIGEHQSLIQFARLLDTIPYEVLTSLSDRVHRNYIIN